jgi:transposase
LPWTYFAQEGRAQGRGFVTGYVRLLGGRALRQLGHQPRIIPAIYVKPFVKRQKNDYNDAEAIAEAALRPNLRVVREKTQDQLDLQALHRVRSRLVSRLAAKKPPNRTVLQAGEKRDNLSDESRSMVK